MKSKSLSLYRQSLRLIKDIPIPAIRKKMIYNIRELFAIYRDASPSKVDEVIVDGTRDLTLLKDILKGRKDTVYNLFKSFDNLNEKESDSRKESDVQFLNREIVPL